MNTKPPNYAHRPADFVISKLGAKRANATLNSIIVGGITLFFMAWGAGAILMADNKEQSSLASGVSEELTIDQLKTQVKVEELREQIQARQAQLKSKNKGFINSMGLLEGSELASSELEIAKNVDESKRLDKCLAEIDGGKADFNCPKLAEEEVRK